MSVSRQRRERAGFAAALAPRSACGWPARGEDLASIFQSEGAYSIPQKLPGTPSSRPISQAAGSPPRGTTSTTRAVVHRFAETISRLNLNALRQRARQNQTASMSVDQCGIACRGKWQLRIEAGDQHWNFQREPGAASDRVLCFFRRAHKVIRQKVLRSEILELESTGVSGHTCPRTMLDHRKAPGTDFRRPVSS